MTQRLVLGVDPGQTGAIALLADGQPAGFIDMPTKERRAGGLQIDGASLAAQIRGVRQQHAGAYTFAVIEQVSAGPGQGVSGMFRFGQADGIVRGVLDALGIPSIEVHPLTWKRYLQLQGQEKDAARLMVLQRFPGLAAMLARKKDVGRADALLVALWAELTEQIGRAA